MPYISKSVSKVNVPKALGIVPAKSLFDKYRYCNLLIDKRKVGRVPAKLLPTIFSDAMDGKLAAYWLSVPVNLLDWILRSCRLLS